MDGWIDELVSRGMDRPYATELVASRDPEQIANALAYFDSLGAGAGPGLLVLAVREGRRPQAKAHTVAEREAAYGREIVDWLREHFPQWNREEGNRTHSAAIACVIRLRHRHGKGSLSVREHGREIREAVASFEAEYGSAGGEG